MAAFQSPLQPQQQQQQQPPGTFGATNQLNLFTNERIPVSYSTKWSDIHPDSQRLLQCLETKILEYRDESRRLDQCQRLYDTNALNKGFELDAARITQELAGVAIAIEREQACLQDLMAAAKDLLRNAEVVVRSFMMLRLRFPHPSTNTPVSQGSDSYHDFYSGIPVKPSPFLQQTVNNFESKLIEYRQWIEELERLLLHNDKEDRSGSQLSLLQSLPSVMGNLHDFFIHVAAEVESLHEFLESMRVAYLADQRRRGDDNDPFLEADRREVAKREAADRRVHPSALRPYEQQPQQQQQQQQQQANLMLPSSSNTGFAGFPAASSSSAASTASFFPSSSATQSSFFTPSVPSNSTTIASSLFGNGSATTVTAAAAAARTKSQKPSSRRK